MPIVYSLKRSGAATGTNAKRPLPASLLVGEPAINYNSVDPALYFRTSSNVLGGTYEKIAPIYTGATAPNAVPPTGGATLGAPGELWLDTTTDKLRIYNGSNWLTSGYLETTGQFQPYDIIFPPPLHVWGSKRLITEPGTEYTMALNRATPNGNNILPIRPPSLNTLLNNKIETLASGETYLRATRFYDQVGLRTMGNGIMAYKDVSIPLTKVGPIYVPRVTQKMTSMTGNIATASGPAFWLAVQFTFGIFSGTPRTLVEFNSATNLSTVAAGGFSVVQDTGTSIRLNKGNNTSSIPITGFNTTGVNTLVFYDSGTASSTLRASVNGGGLNALQLGPTPTATPWSSDGTNYSDSNLTIGGNANTTNTAANFENGIVSLAYYIGPRGTDPSQTDMGRLAAALHNSVQ